jgi:hypothetical protein
MQSSELSEFSNALSSSNWHRSVTVASAANDDDPVNAEFAWGGEVLVGGFGGAGEDLPGSLEADNAFESNTPLPSEDRSSYDSVMGRKIQGKKMAAFFLLNNFLPQNFLLLKRRTDCAHELMLSLSLAAGRCLKVGMRTKRLLISSAELPQSSVPFLWLTDRLLR